MQGLQSSYKVGMVALGVKLHGSRENEAGAVRSSGVPDPLGLHLTKTDNLCVV